MAYFPVTPSGLPTEESPALAQKAAWGPATACAGILLGAIAATALAARSITGGTFVYPVDDAYIHMAAAKHFVESAGQDRTLFAASSSIAWPWLLVALRYVSIEGAAPLLLNVAAALGVFAIVHRAFRAQAVPRAPLFALALCLLAPIVPLVLSGMEHTLHAAFVLAVACLGARSHASARRNTWLYFAAVGAVALRYEGAFVVGAVALLFLRAKRGREAGLLLLAGAAPALVRGVASVAQGGLFFPLPVMMKRTAFTADLAVKIYYRVIDNPHVLVTLVLLAFAWTLDAKENDAPARERKALVFIASTTLAAQTVFAQLGWFYRYEAYALLLSFTAITMVAASHARRLRAFALPAAVLLLPLVGRAAGAFRTTVLASRNIFDQEMQMAAFVHAYDDAGAVALNDIGAVSYATHAHVVDLIGLGSPRIAAARGMRIDGALSKDAIDAETRKSDARIAILYEDWFVGSLPSTWRKVGTWTIPENHVCAKDTVTFYATTDDDERVLRENFRAFATRLPEGVVAKEL